MNPPLYCISCCRIRPLKTCEEQFQKESNCTTYYCTECWFMKTRLKCQFCKYRFVKYCSCDYCFAFETSSNLCNICFKQFQSLDCSLHDFIYDQNETDVDQD